MGGFSLWHILIFAIIVLLLFGGNRFSAMMGDVAKGLKSFKQGMSEDDEDKARQRSSRRRASARPPPAAADRHHAAARRADGPRRRRRRRHEPASARATADVRRRYVGTADRRGRRAAVHRPQGSAAARCCTVGRWVGKVRGYAAPFHRGHRECRCARPSSRKWKRSGARRISASSRTIRPTAIIPIRSRRH